MLKHRLAYGSAMFAALAGLVCADHHLENVVIQGTILQTLLPQIQVLPAGVLILPIMLGLIALAARELHALLEAAGLTCSRGSVILAAMGGFLTTTILPHLVGETRGPATGLAAVAIITALGLLVPSFRKQKADGALHACSATLLSTIYLGVMPGFLFLIRRDAGAIDLAALIATTKMGDSGAYFIGRLIGRHKLVPWLSPGKTWEGLAGAVFTATLTLWIIDRIAGGVLIDPLAAASASPESGTLRWLMVLAVGALIGLVGHAGDLAASLLKRNAGVKDAGTVVPGFGGLIDIFDSLLLVAPVVYLLAC